MNKKVFTLVLLAVFMLAQVSAASAAVVDGDITLAAIPTFSTATAIIDLEWSVTGMPAAGVQNVCSYYRPYNAVPVAWIPVVGGATVVTGLTSANGTHSHTLANVDQDVVEFYTQVEDTVCGGPDAPVAADDAMVSTFIDAQRPFFLEGLPPYLDTDFFGTNNPVSCNTFEFWSVASDYVGPFFFIGSDAGYSGFKAWNQSVTGTFAPPTPEGPDNSFLSWVYTFPSTATGLWTFKINPEDYAGNTMFVPPGGYPFRDALAIDPDELEDCADFSDVAGHANEVYIRYLADLELISGFADGTFGPDSTLTRAEAATLFEKANGVTDADPGFATPPAAGSACDFTDVIAGDWFAGWVWAACADGFMNGIGGGLFDPNNLLTRGQIVTIFNNIAITPDVGAVGSYLEDDSPNERSMLNYFWGWSEVVYGREFREAAWTDVAIGAYYAVPVVRAYGIGVVDGTSATAFSPDQAALRGEFAKMLYRALSRINP